MLTTSLLLLVAAATSVLAPCPNIPSIPDFSSDKIIGTWYGQEEYGKGFLSVLMQCPKFVFQPNDNGTNSLTISGAYNGAFYTVKLLFVPTEKGNVYNVSGNEPIIGEILVTSGIVGSDYEKWIVAYACKETFFGTINVGYLLVANTSVNFTQAEDDIINQKLQSIGFSRNSLHAGCSAFKPPSRNIFTKLWKGFKTFLSYFQNWI